MEIELRRCLEEENEPTNRRGAHGGRCLEKMVSSEDQLGGEK